MKHLATFGRFWYDFIIGDDWRLALGVVAALTAGAYVAHHGLDAWWSLPVAVAALLAVSVNHAARTPNAPNHAHTGPPLLNSRDTDGEVDS